MSVIEKSYDAAPVGDAGSLSPAGERVGVRGNPSSAAVILASANDLDAAMQEERFLRIKNDVSLPPAHSQRPSRWPARVRRP